MKIKVKDISYEELANISGKKHVKPEPPKFWAQALVRLLSIGELKKVNFTSTSVGKEKLMRMIGCIPTQKFVTDPVLVKDIYHLLKKEKSSVLMYPEASYSFDGTATPLPGSINKGRSI